MKFVRNLSSPPSDLEGIEVALLYQLSEPKSFNDLVKEFDFRYLDGSPPDEGDVALAMVHLMDVGAVEPLK